MDPPHALVPEVRFPRVRYKRPVNRFALNYGYTGPACTGRCDCPEFGTRIPFTGFSINYGSTDPRYGRRPGRSSPRRPSHGFRKLADFDRLRPGRPKRSQARAPSPGTLAQSTLNWPVLTASAQSSLIRALAASAMGAVFGRFSPPQH